MTRAAMWALLAVVAAAAAVLSFSALRDLAGLCGFAPGLAWLLPIVVDAGAAAGCLIWLGEHHDGQRFARTFTWVLLAASVTGNAVVHGLTAYHLAPPWWLVVAVSAVAPAVLGAVVHLAVLASQARTEPSVSAADEFGELGEGDDTPDLWATAPYADTPSGRAAELLAAGAGRRKLAAELGVTEHEARKIIAGRNGVADQ